ncbi:MAG: outer membrane protein assembly factor BamE, partial [Caulobacteraceae bacterium]|nr:outer membrane protein assembly factor BamE [Caulobacteraceae bacterium]
GACAPITTYSGFQAIDADPKDVAVGTDTKSTVRGRLGSPSVTSTFEDNVWFYVAQVKEQIAFRKPVVVNREVVAIRFNEDTEVVEAVDHYTLEDGKQIAYSDRETPTRGRELTVLEQLLGNVGRGGMLPRDDESVPGNRPGDRR